MNFGDCPYDGCAGHFMFEVPAKTPAYAKVECETCRRPVWYRFSRLDPEAWTEAAFLAEFDINEATREVKPK